MRSNGNFRGDAKEILAILPRVVRHAADHALLIEQFIRERWDGAHVNAAENKHAALFERLESGGNNLSCWRKHNRSVEFFRWFVKRPSGPRSAQLQRQLLMPHVARRCKHFNAPVPRHLNRHVGRGAKAIKAQPPATLDS